MYVEIQERQSEIIKLQTEIIDMLYLIAAQHAFVAQTEFDGINDKIFQAAQLRKSIGEE